MSAKELAKFYECGKKIVGAALNYKSYVKEKNVVIPSEPIVYLKPTTSYIKHGQTIQVDSTHKMNHEVAIGVVIEKRCKNIEKDKAFDYIGGFCIAIEFTPLDLLKLTRNSGDPWDLPKGFDNSLVVTKMLKKECLGDAKSVPFWLALNGTKTQEGNTEDMVFSIAEFMSYVTKIITLEPCDLLLTGTPAGGCPVQGGDVLSVGIGEPEEELLRTAFEVKGNKKKDK